MSEKFERKLNVLYDLFYVVFHAGMAKRIQSGESINFKTIKKKADDLLKYPGLTKKQFRQVQDYYYPYKVSTLAHRELTAFTGEFRVDYIPPEMYYAYIDPYLNDKKRSPGLENKCLFPKLFPSTKQPENIAFRMNGLWLDTEYSVISFEEVIRLAAGEKDLFIKKADDSYGGKGINHLKVSDNEDIGTALENAVAEITGDIVIQKPLHQHPDMARINPSSVNTLRMITLLMPDGVRVLGAVMRCASDNKSVDNFTSGGLMCGLDQDGRLKKKAYSHTENYETHPASGVRFEGYQIPSYDRAKELVINAHPLVPWFRLIGWDISIDESGEPVMIEANLCTLGHGTAQIANCPLFGNDTRKIIDEALRGTDYPRRHKRRKVKDE